MLGVTRHLRRVVFSGDGGPATSADLRLPLGLAVHPRTGNVYIADSLNCRVRKVDAASRGISTVAGNGCPCTLETNQDCLESGALFGPYLSALTFKSKGDLFVVDTYYSVVWKISVGSNTPVAFAGQKTPPVANDDPEAMSNTTASFMPAASGDGGPAPEATLIYPIDVAVHPLYDDVFFAESLPGEVGARIRKVNAISGIITLAVGTDMPFEDGQEYASGDGGPPLDAQLKSAYALGVTPDGALVIAENTDVHDAFIRKVSCYACFA